jgi:hypothetical protein
MSTNPTSPNYSRKPSNRQIPYRDIKITAHAKQRAYERLGLRSETEIQKRAKSAKYNGIKIRALTCDNYQDFNISYDMYRYLKNHYNHQYKSDKIYYYKDYVYVFSGDRSRCLKSIVPCTEQDMREAIAKLDANRYTPDTNSAKNGSVVDLEPVE